MRSTLRSTSMRLRKYLAMRQKSYSWGEEESEEELPIYGYYPWQAFVGTASAVLLGMGTAKLLVPSLTTAMSKTLIAPLLGNVLGIPIALLIGLGGLVVSFIPTLLRRGKVIDL